MLLLLLQSLCSSHISLPQIMAGCTRCLTQCTMDQGLCQYVHCWLHLPLPSSHLLWLDTMAFLSLVPAASHPDSMLLGCGPVTYPGPDASKKVSYSVAPVTAATALLATVRQLITSVATSASATGTCRPAEQHNRWYTAGDHAGVQHVVHQAASETPSTVSCLTVTLHPLPPHNYPLAHTP
jgi:hypothetical protein